MSPGPLPREEPRCAGDGPRARHAERPRVLGAGRWGGRTHGAVVASADGRGARAGPRLAGAGVDAGLRAAAEAARVWRCVRIWSITEICVMNATMRIGLGLTSHPARAAGVPAVGPRGRVAVVFNLHHNPCQELEWVGGFGTRCWALGVVGAVGDRFRGPVVRQPLQRDRIAGQEPVPDPAAPAELVSA